MAGEEEEERGRQRGVVDGGDPWDPGVALADAGWKERKGQRRRVPFFLFFF